MLPSPLPPHCPSCKTALIPPESDFYGSPDYLAHQLQTHQEEALSRVRGVGEPKTEADSKKLQAEQEVAGKKLEKLLAELARWARVCPTEDKLAALFDAQLIMQNAMHANMSIDTLRKLTAMGKHIGKIATAIEDYFRHGGEPHDPEARRVPTHTEYDSGGEEKPD